MKRHQKISAAALMLAIATACAATDTKGSHSLGLASDKKIYVFESDANGFNTKTVFYDNGAEVVAFDAQFTPALAQQAIAFLKTKTDRPLHYLVVTHPNPDKFNGIKVFQDAGVKVIASKASIQAMPDVQRYKKNYFVNVAHMFTDAQYPTLGQVDMAFTGQMDLSLANGEKIHLQELQGPGVSSTQTVAYIPAVNVLVVGDLIHHKAHAWLEGGIVNGAPKPTLATWISDLEELSQAYGKSNPIAYGGRGEAVPLQAAIPEQIAYLRTADKIVGDYVTALGARRQELTNEKAGEHFANLQKKLEAAFPDYTLGYMIQYGVYGLALSK